MSPAATATRINPSAINVSGTPSIRTSSPTMAGSASGSWIAYFEWEDPGDGLGQHRAAFVDGTGSVEIHQIHGLGGSVAQEYTDSAVVGDDFYVVWYQMFDTGLVEVRLAQGNQTEPFFSSVIGTFDIWEAAYPAKPRLAASDDQIAVTYGNEAHVWTRDLDTGQEETYDNLDLVHPGWQEGWDVAVDGHDVYVAGKGRDDFSRLIRMDGSTGAMADLEVSAGADPTVLPSMEIEAGDGFLYVAYAVGGDRGPGIFLAESTDRGNTFTMTPIGFRCKDDHDAWISCSTDLRLELSGGNPFLAYTDRITQREGVEQYRIFAYQCLLATCSEAVVAEGRGLQEVSASDTEVFISFYQGRWVPDPAHPDQFGGHRWVDDLFVASKPLTGTEFDIENVSDSSDPDAWDPRWGTDLVSSSAGYAVAWPEIWRDTDGDLIESDLFTSSGGGVDGNLEILESQAVQSVLGIDRLVRLKPTAIEVQLRNGMGTPLSTYIELIVHDGPTTSTETFPVTLGRGNRRIFLNPTPRLSPKFDEFDYEVRLDPNNVISESDESDNSHGNTYPVKDTKPFSALFVALKTPGHANGPTDAEMKKMTESAERYVEAAWPLDPLQVNFTYAPGFAIDVRETVEAGESADELIARAWTPLAKLNPSKSWDAVVGVANDFNWVLDEGKPLSNAAGLSLWSPGETGVSLVDAGAYGGATVAHEISHDFRWVTAGHPLTDTISDPARQAHIDLASAETQGYWVERDQYLRRFDYMYWTSSSSGVSDPLAEWPSEVTYDFLFDRFADNPQDPPLVAIRGQVDSTGAVTAGPWYSTDGFLDAELGDTGYYAVRYLDDSGAVVGETGFGVAPTDHPHGESHGSIASADAPLSVNVPDVPGTKKIQILHDDVVLYERTRSDNAPTVQVLGPNGGETLRVGDTMAVAWDSSDADGDELESMVSISTDGGGTWVPIGTDVRGTSLDFELTRSLVSTEVLVKVMTTDGLNTGEDVSDVPFEIALAPPSAEQIVYAIPETRRTCSNFGCSGVDNDDIYVIDPDGSHRVELINTSTIVERDPEWSPGGDEIAIARGGDIYVVDKDGGNLRQVTSTPETDSNPTWSPDGTRLAFERRVPPPGGGPVVSAVFVVDVDGSNEVMITSLDAASFDPEWSPAGGEIAFSRVGDVWVVEPDGTGETRLTFEAESSSFGVHGCQEPAWSPDASTIACVITDTAGSTVYQEIGYFNRSDPSWLFNWTRFRDVHGQNRRLGEIAWSPDGSKVAMVDLTGGSANSQLRVAPKGSDNGWVSSIVPNTEQIFGDFSWKPARQAAEELPSVFPTADAGGAYLTEEGNAVNLDASASSGEGSLDYDWDFDADGDFSDGSGMQPAFVPPDDGTFEVKVRVTDDTGQIAVDGAEIQVQNLDPVIAEMVVTQDAAGAGYVGATVDDVDSDNLSAEIDWGDGSPLDTVNLVESSEGRLLSAWHAFGDGGPHTVQLTVTDDDDGTDTQTRETTSIPSNVAPTASDVSVTTDADVPVDVDLAATDVDGPQTPTYEIVEGPAHGGLVAGLQGDDASLRYVPETGYVGPDSFTYRAFDGRVWSNIATTTIEVRALKPDGGAPPGPLPTTTSTPPSDPEPTPTAEPTPDPEPEPELCTITGTDDNDRLVGTDGDDVICAGAGDDTVLGGGGDDLVLAGRGRDRVRAGSGSDEVLGRRGVDVLRGGAGRDALFGGAARDSLFGGAGRDRLEGGPHRDALDGGPGTDLCAAEPVAVLRRCEPASNESETSVRERRPARWGSES